MGLWKLILLGAVLYLIFQPGRLRLFGKASRDFLTEFKKGAQGKSDIDVTEISSRSSREDE